MLGASFAALSSAIAFAADTWNGGTDTHWSTGGNWTSGSAPGAGDTVVIDQTGSTAPSTYDISQTYGSVTFESGVTLTNAGTNTFGISSGGSITDSASSAVVFSSNMPVTLNGSGATVNVTAGSLTFGGGFTGTGSLTTNNSVGNGALVFLGTTNITGTTTVQTGSLQLGDGTNNGTIAGAIAINSGATLAFNEGSTATEAGNITGAGQVTVSGPGTVILTGTGNSWSGGTTINSGGTLQIGSDTLQGSISASGNVSLNGGTLDFHNLVSSVFDYAGVISGNGNVAIDQGTIVYTNTNTYSGTTTIGANGTLQIGLNGAGAGGINSTAAIVDNGTLTVENFGTTATISGGVSGTGKLVLDTASPTDTLILTGTNTYASGSTTIADTSIDEGTLQIGNLATNSTGSIAGNIALSSNGTIDFNDIDPSHNTISGFIAGTGTLQVDSGTVILTNSANAIATTNITGGTLQIGDGVSNTGSLLSTTITDNGTLAFDPPSASTLYISGAISGTGGLDQMGPGTTLLTGAETFTGNSTVSSGTLEFGSGATFTGTPTQTFNLTSSSATLAFGNTSTLTFASAITGTGNVSVVGNAPVIFTNTDSYSGATSIAAGGTLQIGSSTAVGDTSTIAGAITGTSGVTIASGGNLDFVNLSSTTFSAPISGAGSVTVDLTSGSMALSGNNTYSGGTNIEAGTLQVSAPTNLGSGSVNFTNGATLQVTGTSLSDYTQAATLGTGGGTIDTDGQVVTWSGVISDVTNVHGSLTVTDSTGPNTGVLVLTGNDTYSGGTTITTSGALQIGNETGTGSIAGNVTDNGSLYFDYGGNTSFTGVISGTGQVSQDDTKGGTLTLSGTNTYSGPTNIIAGTLAVSSDANLGNASATNSVNIDNGATLETTATGSFANELFLNGSATLEVKSGTTATWNGQLSDGTSPGTLNVSGGGTLVLANTTASPNSYSGGTVVLGNSTLSIDSDAELGASTGGLTLGDSTSNTGGTLDVSQSFTLGSARVVALAGPGGTVKTENGVTFEVAQGITGSGALNVAGTGKFVLAGASSYTGNTNIASGATLQLGDGTNAGTIASTTVNDNGTLAFNEAGNASFSGAIQGSGSLIQDDTSATPGTLTLTGADSYTGTTTITSGTLQLGDGTTAGTLQSSQIADASALVFDEPSNSTYAGVISGPGTVEVSGPATLTLTGTNTYTGTTTIDTGATLQLGNGGASGSISNSASIVDNGTLTIDTNGTTTLTGAISGTNGQLMQVGSGTTILAGDNTYGGTTTVSSGALQIGGGTTSTSGSLTSNIDNSASVIFSRADTSTYGGVISGSGTVTIADGVSGTTIFTGNNTYTGTTTVSSGTLQIGNGGASGALAGNVTVGTDGNLTFDRSDTSSYGGVISGAGTVTVADGTNGVTVLTGSNTYTGTTTVNSGTLQIGGGTTSTSGELASNVTLANNSNLTFSRADTSTYAGTITGQGSVTVADGANGVTVLTADSSYSGPTTIASGTLQLGSASTAGSFTGNVTDNGTLAFDRSNSYTYAGVISGSGGVTQAGNGQTTLTAAETYTGATEVNAGTLVVNGSITSPNGVTVNSGGTLAGTGSVSALTVKSNGTVTTGSGGIGTLTVNGSFILGAGGTYSAQVTPTSADLLNVKGTADLQGALVVTPTGTGFSSTPITILQASGGITGQFTNVTFLGNLSEIPIVSYVGDDVDLTFAPSVTSLLPTTSTNTNQSRVADAIDFALTHDNAVAFTPVTSESGTALTQTLSQLSGETAVGFQNVAVSSVASFMSTLFDPSIGGRGGLGAGIDGISDNHAMQQVAFNGANSDMPYQHPSLRSVTIWTDFYGFENTTDADESLGTHRTTSTQFGGTVGLDYRPKKGDGAIGIAFGMSGTSWNLSDQLGRGEATAYQIGTYYSRRFRDTYFTAGLSYARYSTSTDRTVDLSGENLYHADFVSNSVTARAEAGHAFHTEIGRITPYANFQGDDIGVPHYSEQTQAGSPDYALSYTGKQHYDYASEAGVGWNALIDQLTDIHARAGWLHDYAGGLNDTATFSAFNGSSFLVDGASPPKNAAHVLFGLTHDETNVVLALNGEAAIAGNSTSYGGTASISFHW